MKKQTADLSLARAELGQIQDYYDSFYGRHQQTRRNFCAQGMRSREAYEVFLDFLRADTGKMLLDVGCGTGMLLRVATERGLTAYGVDISLKAVEFSKQNSPSSGIYKSCAEDLPFENGVFDYVTCIGTLEHLLDIEQGLGEIRRVSREDAKIMIVVPNQNSYLWILRRDKGTQQREIGEKLHSLREWRERFEENGFKIDSVHRDIWRMRDRFQLKWIIKWILRKVIPLRYTYQFVFILTKSPQTQLSSHKPLEIVREGEI